jgi:putative transposase
MCVKSRRRPRFALSRAYARIVPRPPRPQIAGAVYHVTARAVDRQPLFRDASDYVHCLRIVERIVRRYAVSCLFYCLMGTHYHFVLRPRLANISRAVQFLNGRYAQDFNDRHGREGHLLERRFRAVVIETDEQLLTVVRYLARNPVEARLAPSPQAWRWSAYPAAIGVVRVPAFLDLEPVLELFAPRRGARAHLRAFVEHVEPHAARRAPASLAA